MPNSDHQPNQVASSKLASASIGLTQTHNHAHLLHPHRLNLQSKQQTKRLQKHLVKYTDPIIVANANVATTSNSKTPQPQQPPPPIATNGEAVILYRECLRNYAASMGGHVVDGCGEFMPAGEEGTPEAWKCAACDCHRNFHRKVVGAGNIHAYNLCRNNTRTTPSPPPPPPHSHGYGTGAPTESSSEDLPAFQSNAGEAKPSISTPRKRFRTKFSQEQKIKMQEFGEKLKWKIQKEDEEQVKQFCSEMGVKRQVFKVWMHNNKQAMKKKQI